MTTLLFTHEACFAHDPGRMHPEHPARLKAVLTALSGPEFAALERREAPEATIAQRSEERRVGKECVSTCRSRWSPCTLKTNQNIHKLSHEQQTDHTVDTT